MSNQDFLLHRGGKSISLPVITADSGGARPMMEISHTNKTTVYQILGDSDAYSNQGTGSKTIKLSLAFTTNAQWYEFYNFVIQKNVMLLSMPNGFQENVNLLGDFTETVFYGSDGNRNCDIMFTTATSIFEQEQILTQTGVSETVVSKASFLDSLSTLANKIFDFTSATNTKIGAITNEVALVTTQIDSIAQSFTAARSILTNPANAIKNSVSSIINNLNTISTTLKLLPSDITYLTQTIIDANDALLNAFTLDNQADTFKYNIKFGSSFCDSVIDKFEANPHSGVYGTSYLALDIRENAQAFRVLFLSSVLIGIYDKIEEVARWNKTELEDVKTKTDRVYTFVTQTNLLDIIILEKLALYHVRFLKTYKNLLIKSTKLVEITLPKARNLADVVYSVNGNLDYFIETYNYNNIIEPLFVQGTIFVFSNE